VVIPLESLRSSFVARYGGDPRIFSAPGRVNLIGEHTDYNDGFVLPMAIDRRTYVAAARRRDRKVRARADDIGEEREFDLDRPGSGRRRNFVDYVEGTAQALISRGAHLAGADMIIASDVPAGAGLSSSAALEISTGFALLSLAGEDDFPRAELARAGQAAEHTYVGILCGIMDQFIATLGRADHALLIDCRTLEARPVPLSLPGSVVLVCDTKVKHQLASSEYNKRRAECQRGVDLLRASLPDVRALRDVSVDAFERHESMLSELVRKRCRHVITENARTLAAAEALERNDLRETGRLMFESHRSLRDDYEVSCPELDLSVEVARAVPGVYGARMTGGGFGGCTVNLVDEKAVRPLTDALAAGLEERFGRTPDIFTSRAGEGAKEHT
jgi:galactokinase